MYGSRATTPQLNSGLPGLVAELLRVENVPSVAIVHVGTRPEPEIILRFLFWLTIRR